ncbi:MAG TPA: hypothetical protein PLM29_07645, partial [Deltaproteobacteria bacterium]|nr:hypothetical protein [Deltaproteobacteria bacterium]
MMKRIIGKVSLVVCVVCLVSLPGAWAAQKLNTKTGSTQSPTPGLTSVVVSISPASLSRTSSAAVQNRAPALLSAQEKAALINEVRAQAGKQRLEVPPAVNEVVLTPSQPSSGNSWLACVKGTFYANPPHGRADVKRGDDGQIELEFAPLRSGSFYLVDCTVETYDSGNRQENARWKVMGTNTSYIPEEGGHMCFSFRANGSSAH